MYGEGCLKEETIGRYTYYCLQYYDNCGKKRKKRFPFTKQGERDAKRFQSEMFRKKSDGMLVTCNFTVQSWVREFIDTYKLNALRDSSLERMIQTYNKIEVSPIANVPLDKLTGNQIQNFYNLLSDKWTDSTGKEQKALSSSSIAKVHRLLVSAYRKALQQRLIFLNPMDTVDPVKVRTKEMSVFTWRELGKIFRAIRKYQAYKYNNSQRHDYRLLFSMLLYTGCRAGELLALQWQDVNFRKMEIHFHATKAMNSQSFNDPKTKSGNRYSPILSNKLLEMLKEYRKRNGVIKTQGFIFENKSGGAISYQRVFLTWQRICELAGIEERGLHTFRHTCATYLLERGIPVAEVSRILGHSSPEITYKLYVHSVPGFNARIIKQFQQKQRPENSADNSSDSF